MKAYVNCYEVIIRSFNLTSNFSYCTVFVPELNVTVDVPQSIIEIK